MRKVIVIVLAIFMIATTAAYASTDNIADGMGKKAIRGVVNLFTGILEIPMQIYKGWNNGMEPIKDPGLSKCTGAVVGIFTGIAHAAGRTGWGALELFGFWTANPVDNNGVGLPLDAEYSWEMGTQHNIFKPSFQEGFVNPVGYKLVRGLSDTFLGVADLPGQVIQGAKKNDLGIGIIRGIWFWFSREMYGAANLYGFLFPNPPDNPGYAFDGEWPWTTLANVTK